MRQLGSLVLVDDEFKLDGLKISSTVGCSEVQKIHLNNWFKVEVLYEDKAFGSLSKTLSLSIIVGIVKEVGKPFDNHFYN